MGGGLGNCGAPEQLPGQLAGGVDEAGIRRRFGVVDKDDLFNRFLQNLLTVLVD